MRIQTVIVNDGIFIQCYDTFESMNEHDSAEYFRDYCNKHNAAFTCKELEENENGVYYFEITDRLESIKKLIDIYSKSQLINYFNQVYNNEIIKIKQWLKNMKTKKDI